MTSHIVMIPPGIARDDEAVAAQYVADRFSIWAFIFPVIWALWHKLWLEAIALAVTAGFIAVAGSSFGGTSGEIISVFAGLFVSALVGLESGTIRAAALRRRGWREVSIVDAQNADEAAIRFASDLGRQQQQVKPEAPVENPFGRRATQRRISIPATGLLTMPGDR